MRTTKDIAGLGDINYLYEGGLLLQMNYLGYIYDFSYDVNGSPIGFRLDNGSYYYYGTNSRGDIIAIYNQSGTKLATYSYDAYGKFLGTTYTSTTNYNDNLAIDHNPLRYRGYVYDRETGFYYLQTRYYDPTTCRFINGDSQLNTDSFTGYNMFAYCSNNPIKSYDPNGTIEFECCPNNNCRWCQEGKKVGAAPEYNHVKGSDDTNSPNCYAYAIGSDVNEQPGEESGTIISDWTNVYEVGDAVVADLKCKGYTVRDLLGPKSPISDNEYRIALRVGTSIDPCLYYYQGIIYIDYHFMVQTSTGCWAEKHGTSGASIYWDNGLSPDLLPWTLHGHEYYDSKILYYAIGR